jgi:hypothetical protein
LAHTWLQENEDHNVKQSKPDGERQILHIFSHMQNLNLETKRE